MKHGQHIVFFLAALLCSSIVRAEHSLGIGYGGSGAIVNNEDAKYSSSIWSGHPYLLYSYKLSPNLRLGANYTSSGSGLLETISKDKGDTSYKQFQAYAGLILPLRIADIELKLGAAANHYSYLKKDGINREVESFSPYVGLGAAIPIGNRWTFNMDTTTSMSGDFAWMEFVASVNYHW